ncbi:MAG: hypothetical protein WBO58_08650 [Gammaproteobacteria bacterium]
MISTPGIRCSNPDNANSVLPVILIGLVDVDTVLKVEDSDFTYLSK